MGVDLLQKDQKEISEMKAMFCILVEMVVAQVFVKIHQTVYLEMGAFYCTYIIPQ